jgi:hypothetical protein
MMVRAQPPSDPVDTPGAAVQSLIREIADPESRETGNSMQE